MHSPVVALYPKLPHVFSSQKRAHPFGSEAAGSDVGTTLGLNPVISQPNHCALAGKKVQDDGGRFEAEEGAIVVTVDVVATAEEVVVGTTVVGAAVVEAVVVPAAGALHAKQPNTK